MASVYRAVADVDPNQGSAQEVALKILDATTADASARLRAEAAALSRLSHPGVASVYELIEDDGCLALAMEFVSGQSLQHLLEQGAVLAPRQAAEFCLQLLAALEHVHAAGVVHRDLKPGNVMVTESGTVKITDFGIARLDGATGLTASGKMLGTPAYMAPEQVLGHPVDERADLYAIGIMLFRLVTGGLPFKGATPFEMAQAQVNDAPARARDARPDLPEWLDDILMRALAKRPAYRFQSAPEFREALARAGAETAEPVVSVVERTEAMVRPVIDDPPPAATAPSRPHRLWMFAGVAAALVAAAWLSFSIGSAAVDSPVVASMVQDPAPDPPASPVVTPDPTTTPAADRVPNRPTRTTRPVDAPVPSPPSVSFDDVKWLRVTGARTSAADAVVQFRDTDVTLHAGSGEGATITMPYQRIAKATYTHARDPQWDPDFSRPAGKISVSGIFGRERYWLVLQGVDDYVVLRLDGDDRNAVMKAFEERARLSIDRRQAIKSPD